MRKRKNWSMSLGSLRRALVSWSWSTAWELMRGLDWEEMTVATVLKRLVAAASCWT